MSTTQNTNRAAQYILHSHPASQAAKITSDAMRAAYDSYRRIPASAANKSDRNTAKRGLEMAERIHERVTEKLKSTPEAWFSFADQAVR